MNFMLEDGGKRAYGLESIRVYAEALNAVRHGHVKLDRRNGYFLQEYMELMYRRFRFLSDQNLFRITDRDTDLLSAACAEMKKGLALVLKYQVRNDPVLLGRAEDTYLSFVDKYQPWFQEMSDRFFEN